MRSLVNITSKLAMASAIAQMGIENATDDKAAMEAYKQMDDAAMSALAAFPGALSDKEYTFVQNRLSKFIDKVGWDDASHDVKKLLIFNTEQIETMRYELLSHSADVEKINAIDRLVSIEASIYDRYSVIGENPDDNIGGLAANDTWNQIFSS